MKQYQEYLKYILENGTKKEDRTGTGTISVFGYQMRFDLSKGFPLVTTKKLHFKSIAYELLWFLRGDTNTKFLTDNGVTIWDEWSLKEDYLEPHYDDNDNTSYYIKKANKGDIGRMYGYQWVSYEMGFHVILNQITKLMQQLENNPDSRRMLVTAWNPRFLPDEELSPQENVQEGLMALAPCHYSFQVYTQELNLDQRFNIYYNLHPTWVVEDYSHDFFDGHNIPKRSISMIVNQRSADSFLGVPYNIASYALLTEMLAQQCNMIPGELIWNGGDCHIYTNHLEQVNLQLQREPYELPRLNFKRKPESIFDYKYEDFEILDYQAHPHIKGAVAV